MFRTALKITLQILNNLHKYIDLFGSQTILELFSHLRSASYKPTPFAYSSIGELIDHTLLKADARQQDLEKLCAEAAEHRFKAVCVNSSRLKAVSKVSVVSMLIAAMV